MSDCCYIININITNTALNYFFTGIKLNSRMVLILL